MQRPLKFTLLTYGESEKSFKFFWVELRLQIRTCLICFICSGMAVSISMMFARIGSAFGSNIVAYLLENNCQFAFYMSGISLIGKFCNGIQ